MRGMDGRPRKWFAREMLSEQSRNPREPDGSYGPAGSGNREGAGLNVLLQATEAGNGSVTASSMVIRSD